MRILGLDLSKTSTGWACWGEEDAHVASGCWVLGSEYSTWGRVFGKLHEEMTALRQLGEIDAIFMEEPRHLASFNVQSDANSHMLAVGLASHVYSWGECTPGPNRIIRMVNMATWRRDFLGRMKRGTKTVDLKAFAMERARELGFAPRKHDEAEAIGLLDHACNVLNILPPWRAQNPLVQQFGARR